MINDENIDSKCFQRTRFIAAIFYLLLLLAYLIIIIVFIVRYPRCAPVNESIWWKNAVFLRYSSRIEKFDEFSQRLDEFRAKLSPQAIWIPTVFRLSDRSNPIDWNISNDENLTNFIEKLHRNDLRVLVDYPINHLSIQSTKFIDQDRTFFVWNDRGNETNWNSSWIFDQRSNSFYLRQFDDADAIDVNFRNNRVLEEFFSSINDCQKKFDFDGFNLQGISYAYEDFDHRNHTDENSFDRTRHLEENYSFLNRIRQEICDEKLLLLDRIDSLSTPNETILRRYFDDPKKHFHGVQMATIDNYVVKNDDDDVATLFKRYVDSTFYSNFHPFVWMSKSIDSKLNEAFFAASIFHLGAISIEFESLQSNQLERLGKLTKSLRQLNVFRDGEIEQKIDSTTKWLTIERSRRGSRHYMIIVNFSSNDNEQKIILNKGITNAVEVFFSNIEKASNRYENNALLDMSKPIQLKSYEYLIIRWSPTIDGLGILF